MFLLAVSALVMTAPAFDLDAARVRARHAFHRDSSGALIADDGVLRVRLDATGAEIRGAATAPLRLRTLKPAASGAVQLDSRGQAVRGNEEWQLRTSGLEQRWRLPHRPAARTFEVRLEATGAAPRRDATGVVLGAWHLGDATFIDASGKSTAVRWTVEPRGHLALAVPQAVLDVALYPAVLDPTLTPLFPLTPAAVLAPVGGPQTGPRVATDGSLWLVAWMDSRMVNSAVFATRVAADGTVLDPNGLLVVADYEPQQVDVAWGGASAGGYFLVVHSSSLDGPIRGVRVYLNGTFDSTPTWLTQVRDLKREPSVASDGDGFLLAWQEAGGAVRANAILPGLSTVPADGVALNGAPLTSPRHPRVSWSNGQYTVVWADGPPSSADVHGARVDPGATVLSSLIISADVAENEHTPAIAPTGSGWVVGYLRQTVTDVHAMARAVYLDGGASISLDVSGPLVSAGSLSAAPTPTGDVLLGWDALIAGKRQAFVIRVTPAPAPIGSAVLLGAGLEPSAAFTPDAGLFAWSADDSPRDLDVVARRMTPDLAPLDALPLELTWTEASQHRPRIAGDDTGFLVTWQEYRNGTGWDVRGARLDLDGGVLDPDGFPIAATTDDEVEPDVAAWAGGYSVAWVDRTAGEVRHARVSRAGVSLITTPAIATGNPLYKNTRIATNGRHALVVWNLSPGIVAGRVALSGALLDNGPLVLASGLSGSRGAPTVAWGTADYLVAWNDARSGETDIYGGRVRSDGTVLDPSGFAITSADAGQSGPGVGFDGTDFLVSWHDHRVSGRGSMWGARVHDGAVLDPGGIDVVDGNEPISFGYTHQGDSTLMTWVAYSQSRAMAAFLEHGFENDGGFEVGTTANSEAETAGWWGRSSTLLVWTSFAGVARTSRIQARLMRGDPDGTACMTGSSCQGGACSAGVCITRPELDAGPPDEPPVMGGGAGGGGVGGAGGGSGGAGGAGGQRSFRVGCACSETGAPLALLLLALTTLRRRTTVGCSS